MLKILPITLKIMLSKLCTRVVCCIRIYQPFLTALLDLIIKLISRDFDVSICSTIQPAFISSFASYAWIFAAAGEVAKDEKH